MPLKIEMSKIPALYLLYSYIFLACLFDFLFLCGETFVLTTLSCMHYIPSSLGHPNLKDTNFNLKQFIHTYLAAYIVHATVLGSDVNLHFSLQG